MTEFVVVKRDSGITFGIHDIKSESIITLGENPEILNGEIKPCKYAMLSNAENCWCDGQQVKLEQYSKLSGVV